MSTGIRFVGAIAGVAFVVTIIGIVLAMVIGLTIITAASTAFA